jgi:hypothetical protein
MSEVDDTSILRTGLPSSLQLPSQLVTDPSLRHLAQRAGAQRLRAMALSWRLARCRISVRNRRVT